MKWAMMLVAVAAAFGSGGMVRGSSPSSSPDSLVPDPPGPVVVGTMGVVAAGDTLPYTISWGPGARATSYDVTIAVASTNGAWVVARDSNASCAVVGCAWPPTNGLGALPQTSSVTFTLFKTWLAAVPWDSATFTVTIFSRNAVGQSLTGVARTWRVLRRPGPPGPITVDSSLIVIGLQVQPQTATIPLLASRTLCAFQQFGSGAVVQWTVDKPSCDSIYAAYVPVSARALVSAAEQAHTDSQALTCVTWSTLNPLVVGLRPNATCSSAVTVTGLALSWRRALAPRDMVRNVDVPVGVVTPDGRATCLRPGILTVRGVTDRGAVLGPYRIRCYRPETPWRLADR